jgi:hypothetical protein
MQYLFQAFLEATCPMPITHCPHNAQCFDFNLFFFFSYALSPVSGDKRAQMRIEPHPLSLTGRKIMSCEERGVSLLQNVSQECKISAKFQASTFSPDKRAIVSELGFAAKLYIKFVKLPVGSGCREGVCNPHPPFFVRGHGGSALRHSSRERHFENYCRTERSVQFTSDHPIGRNLTLPEKQRIRF